MMRNVGLDLVGVGIASGFGDGEILTARECRCGDVVAVVIVVDVNARRERVKRIIGVDSGWFKNLFIPCFCFLSLCVGIVDNNSCGDWRSVLENGKVGGSGV
jgi:hypothetical protein